MYKTMDEIKTEFDGFWVCIINYKEGEFGEVIGGEVIAHDKNSKAIVEKWGSNSGAYLRYIGSLPEGMGVLL